MIRDRSRYDVAPLAPGTELDPDVLSIVFGAPWRRVARVCLAPGEVYGGRELHDSEALVYVLDGRGTARLHHATAELREGISLTLFKEERLELAAGAEDALEFFMVEMGVAHSGREDDR
jgi:quercetin dioxygenase-like cupin family protein